MADYDETLVTLLGDVATYYAEMRTLEKRIEYTKQNVRLQQRTVTIAEGRFHGGVSTERDPYQARSTLTDPGPNPRVGNRAAADGHPIVHPAGHAAGRFANEAWSGDYPRRTPRMLSSASQPISCAAVPRFAGQNVRRPLKAPKSASPRPISAQPSRSTAPWATRPMLPQPVPP